MSKKKRITRQYPEDTEQTAGVEEIPQTEEQVQDDKIKIEGLPELPTEKVKRETRGRKKKSKAEIQEEENRAFIRQVFPIVIRSVQSILLNRVSDKQLAEALKLNHDEEVLLTDSSIRVAEKYELFNTENLPEIALGAALLSIAENRIRILREYVAKSEAKKPT